MKTNSQRVSFSGHLLQPLPTGAALEIDSSSNACGSTLAFGHRADVSPANSERLRNACVEPVLDELVSLAAKSGYGLRDQSLYLLGRVGLFLITAEALNRADLSSEAVNHFVGETGRVRASRAARRKYAPGAAQENP